MFNSYCYIKFMRKKQNGTGQIDQEKTIFSISTEVWVKRKIQQICQSHNNQRIAGQGAWSVSRWINSAIREKFLREERKTPESEAYHE
jgi:hypothetical protein